MTFSNFSSFSCWWGLIPFTPVLILFIMVQILSIGQYLLKKRLDSLKEVTWGLFDDRHSKSLKIVAERLNKTTPTSVNDLKRSSFKSLFSKSNSVNNESSQNSPKSTPKQNSDKDLDSLSDGGKSDTSESAMIKSDMVIELRNFDESSATKIEENNKQHSLKSVDFDDSELIYVRKMIKRIKFLRFFTTDIFKFVMLFIVFVVSLLSHLIVHGGIEIFTTNACTFEKYPVSTAISASVAPVFIFFGWLLTTVFMILDVIFFIKEEGCSIKNFYFEDDPYGFRIEQLVGFVVLGAMLGIVTLQATLMSVTVISGSQREETFAFSIFRSILVGFVQIFIVTAFSAVGLILSIISWIKMKFFQKKVYDSEFDAFVSTKSGKDIFKKYAKIEWSLENILFFEEIGKYEKIPSKKHAQRRSKEIVQNYIMTGSPLEVNLSHDVRKNTMKKVDNFDEYKEKLKEI
eukprot:gene2023-1530_t